MTKWIWVAALFVCLKWHSTFGSPFLRTLLPQPSPEVSSHISDFRKQPRSDSRADRPDTFPNFDLAAVDTVTQASTTTAHIKTTAERYSEIFGKIIGNTSQRVSKIIKNVEQRRETRHRLRELEAEVQRRMSTTTEFEGLSLDDSDDEDNAKPDISLADDTQQPLPKLFPFSLSRIDFNNLRGLTDAHKQNIRNKIATSAARLINPLFHIWFAATRRNLNANYSPNPLSQQQQQQLDDNDNDALGIRTTADSSSTPTDVLVAATAADTFSDAMVQHTITTSDPYQFPSKDGNDNDDDDDDDDDANVASSTAKVELAFRNAFSKYSNPMSQGYYNNNNKNNYYSDVILPSTNDESVVGIPIAATAAGNFNHITMHSAANVDFPIERINVRIDDAAVGALPDNTNPLLGGENSTGAENVGIFVLEIFGTIVGLGWGAFSQIQSFFTPRN